MSNYVQTKKNLYYNNFFLFLKSFEGAKIFRLFLSQSNQNISQNLVDNLDKTRGSGWSVSMHASDGSFIFILRNTTTWKSIYLIMNEGVYSIRFESDTIIIYFAKIMKDKSIHQHQQSDN